MELNDQKIISLKRIVGAQKPPEKGATKMLVVVFGVCTGVKQGVNDSGAFTRFNGDFISKGLTAKGVKGKTEGEIVGARAGVLQVPETIAEALVADGVGADDTFTEFALKIGITADDKGRPSYVHEYVVKPSQTSPADALVEKHGGEWFGQPKEAAQTQAAPTAKKK